MSKISMPKWIWAILLVVVLIIILGLAVACGILATRMSSVESENSKKASICSTHACVESSADIIKAMDLTADPCENFHQFACGGWAEHNPIPDDRTQLSQFSKLIVKLKYKLKSLLENHSDVEAENEAIRKVKDSYWKCMDEDLLEQQGAGMLLSELENMGNWPIIDSNWAEDQVKLSELLGQLHRMDLKYFLALSVVIDDRNSNNHILKLDQPTLGLQSRDFYVDPIFGHNLQSYKQYMVDIVTLLSPNTTTQTHIEQDVEDMVEFEVFLANITIPPDAGRSETAAYMKITDLYTNISGQIDWLEFTNSVFENVSTVIELGDEIVVHSSVYLREMAERLSITRQRTVINYVLWRMVEEIVPYMPAAYLEAKARYDKVISGVVSKPARWNTCTTYCESYLTMALGRLFVDEFFSQAARDGAVDLIKRIKQKFEEALAGVEWMDEEARKTAKEKVASMYDLVGYPGWIKDDTKLDEDYAELVMTNSFLLNHLATLKWKVTKELRKLHQEVDKTKWPSNSAGWSRSPAWVNAFYSPERNQITFPVGILQTPFWGKDTPMPFNFGAIGFLIGHEITHGFDDIGRRFDKHGNQVQWWSDDVIEKYNEKAQCIIDQYDEYVVPQINTTLNGVQTQGENIADNGSIGPTFEAFKEWQSQSEERENLLPGLEQFSQEQLFFIGFAHSWCGYRRREAYIKAVKSEQHSIKMYRIIGTLSNFEEFSNHFNCEKGSRMNRPEKCVFW